MGHGLVDAINRLAREYGHTLSLDEKIGPDGEATRSEAWAHDNGAQAKRHFDRMALRQSIDMVRDAVDELPARTRAIIVLRWLVWRRWSLAEVAAAIGLSREGVHQIETKALAHLRVIIEHAETEARLVREWNEAEAQRARETPTPAPPGKEVWTYPDGRKVMTPTEPPKEVWTYPDGRKVATPKDPPKKPAARA